jgi:AcrR family transcriptional regulator
MSQPATNLRDTRKAATRQLLKDTAGALFAEQGYAATQIGHITAAAGVAKGTFYVHFPDKDAILDELLAEFNAGLAARVAPLLQAAAGKPRRKLIEAVADTFLTYWSEHRDFVRAYAEKAAGGVDASTLQVGVNRPMQELLVAALGARRAPGFVPELVVQGLLSLWLRLGMQHLFNPGVKRRDVLATLTAMTDGALAAVLRA